MAMHCPTCGQAVTPVLAALMQVNEKLNVLLAQGVTTMADLSAIQSEVSANSDAVGSAVTLLNSLADAVEAAASDPAAIAALASDLRANTSTLAAAVVENTPAGPPA